MIKAVTALLLLAVCLAGFPEFNTAAAQDLSAKARGQLLAGQNKDDANANTTTIITSRTLGGAPMVMVRDLSTLLDAGERFEKMRVVPVVARGKVQNLWDILYPGSVS